MRSPIRCGSQRTVGSCAVDVMLLMKRGPVRRASGGSPGRLRDGASRRYDTSSRMEPENVSTDRVNPSTKGWGVAALIIALAVIANVTAYSIHKATRSEEHTSELQS